MKRLIAEEDMYLLINNYKSILAECIDKCNEFLDIYSAETDLLAVASTNPQKDEQYEIIEAIKSLLKSIADNQKYSDISKQELNKMLDKTIKLQRKYR